MNKVIKFIFVIIALNFVIFAGCGFDPDQVLDKDSDSVLIQDDAVEEETDTESSSETSDPEEDTQTDSDTSSAVAETDTVTICVYVCGAVCDPGVYELSPEDRVYQAIELAGGMSEDANEKGINLAESLSDGEMITVPSVNDPAGTQVTAGTSTSATGTSASASGSGTDETDKVNINTADQEELTSLSGIGEAKAAAIITYREEQGAFQSPDQITEVSGIGEGTYEKIKDRITVQ